MTDRIRINDLRALATGKPNTPDGWVYARQDDLLALIDIADAAGSVVAKDGLCTTCDEYAASTRLRDALAHLDFDTRTAHE